MKGLLKKCAVAFMGGVALTVSAYGIQNLVHTAIPSDVRIVYKGEEAAFELPVVDIDGKLYVPLRETAKKDKGIVFWNGREQKCFVFTDSMAFLEYFLDIDTPASFVLETMEYSLSPHLIDGCNYGDSVALYASGTVEQADIETCVAGLKPCAEADGDFTALLAKIDPEKQSNKLSENALQYYMGTYESDTGKHETYMIFEKLENGKAAFYWSYAYH